MGTGLKATGVKSKVKMYFSLTHSLSSGCLVIKQLQLRSNMKKRR